MLIALYMIPYRYLFRNVLQEGSNRRVREVQALPELRDGGTVVARLLWVDWHGLRRGRGIVMEDPYLQPQEGDVCHRFDLYRKALATIDTDHGGLDVFSRSYEVFGLNRVQLVSVVVSEIY